MPTASPLTQTISVLLMHGASDSGPIRQALSQGKDFVVRLQCVERMAMALARIAGGGVDLVLLDLPTANGHEGAMDSLQQLLRKAPDVPVVVVCGSDNEGLALKAMGAGATNYVMKESLEADLCRVVNSAIELARGAHPPPAVKIPEPHTDGGIIAFLGAKGGVGTTTVALNIAAILARRSTVILVEMRPTFGTLRPFLQPRGTTRNLSHLLSSDSGASGPADTHAFLWIYKDLPGLSVVFGPQSPGECAEIEPERARAVVQSLARKADYVIVDLPSSLSKANQAVVEESASTLIVVERDPVCARLASSMFRAMQAWRDLPPIMGAVIVNRASVGCPTPLSEIEAALGCQVLGVIPPAADLCLSAQNAGAPLVTLAPETLVGGSLDDLLEILTPERSEIQSRISVRERFRV